MSEVTDVIPREVIKYKDKEYTVERPEFEVEGMYSGYLEKGAREAALKFGVGTPAYDAAIKTVVRDAAERHYDWEGPFCQYSLNSERNFSELIYMMINFQLSKEKKPPLDKKFYLKTMWRDPEFRDGAITAWNRLMSPTPQTPPEVPSDTPGEPKTA